MRTLIALSPALGCTAMMLLVCLPMMRARPNTEDKTTREEVDALREEVARLRSKSGEAQTLEAAQAAREQPR